MNEEAFLSYDQLKAFFVVAVGTLSDFPDVPPEDRPISVLAAAEAKSRSLAMKGLKVGIPDLLILIREAGSSKAAEIERALAGAGAPSIGLIRALASRKTGSILSRGRIRTEEEFHQIASLMELSSLSTEQSEKMQNMLDQFEFGSSPDRS